MVARKGYGSGINKFPRDSGLDSVVVEGTPVENIDERTMYVPVDDNTSMDSDQLMIENELLRQELYAQTNRYHARILAYLNSTFGHSTRDIIRKAGDIEMLTKGVIKSQDAFRIIYKGIENQFLINFDMRKPNESKLQYCWRMGILPVVAMYMTSLHHTIQVMTRIDHRIATNYLDKLNNRIKELQKKKKKITK